MVGTAEDIFREVGITPKTSPLSHQSDSLAKSWGRRAFAQLGEMGTGKTWILVNESAALWARGDVDAAVVLAPKGVDVNWLKDQLPKHMPEDVPWDAAVWRANAKKAQRQALSRVAKPDESGERKMYWLLANWDAISTKRGFAFIQSFMENHGRIVMICDEAHRAKNPSTERTRALMKLRPYANWRRIASGSIVLNAPFDVFAPFKFLDPKILGGSFYAFKAEYAQLLKQGNPLYDHIIEPIISAEASKHYDDARALIARENPGAGDEWIEEEAAKTARKIAYEHAKHRFPQVVEKDNSGRPKYRNIERLRDAIAPHSYRVLKEQCLDLPQKIYEKAYFELTPAQRKAYDEAVNNMRLVIDDETVEPMIKLTALGKAGQITSGFFIESAEGEVHRIPGANPKLDLLRDRLESIGDEKIIIWAIKHEELSDIVSAVKDAGLKHVEYSGRIKDAELDVAVESFEEGDVQVFVAQQRKGGTGLTLVAASKVIYYSNSWSLEDRQQSEDRSHRIGQDKHVVYEDLIAEDTIEEEIIAALQDKADLAALVNGDDLLRAMAK